MEIYRLTNEEKKLFTRIANPYVWAGKRITRPVVVAFYKGDNVLAGLSTLTQWRRVIQDVQGYRDAYRFELHNMW